MQDWLEDWGGVQGVTVLLEGVFARREQKMQICTPTELSPFTFTASGRTLSSDTDVGNQQN